MSIINQMLRDLDARQVGASAAPPAAGEAPRRPRPGAARALAGAGVLGAAALAAYALLPDAPAPVAPPEPVSIASRAPDTPAVAPPVEQGRPTEAIPLVQPPVVKPVPPTGDASGAETKLKATLSPLSAPTAPEPESSQPIAQTEPTVVKKMADSTPESEALQRYEEAQALRRAGKAEAAMTRYRQALERNPAMTNARVQLARLLQDDGEPADALALLKAGYELRPDVALATAVGRMLADQGQRDEALDWLARGQSALRPADHALMGALLSQAGRHEEAGRAYQRALAADPGQAGWLLGLGVALEAQGRHDEARTAYRHALERGQFKPEVMRFLRERTAQPEASGP